MLFIALVTVVGLSIGFAVALVSGSTPREIGSRLRALRVENWSVLALGIVLSVAVALDTNMLAGRFALGVSLALLLGGCLLNRHITGACIAAVGIAANLGVLLANGYLPVSEGAVVAAGIIDVDGLDRVLLGAARRWSDDATIAAWLGGAIPLAPLRDVITLGDVVTAAGLANVGFRLMWPVARNLQHLEAVSLSGDDDYDDASVVLIPTAQPTTLEHPPLVGATPAATPAAPAAMPQPSTPATPAAPAPAAPLVTLPPAVTPATPTRVPTHVEPAWASRVEPAPWPAPAPWPQEMPAYDTSAYETQAHETQAHQAQAYAATTSDHLRGDEPTESHDQHLFDA